MKFLFYIMKFVYKVQKLKMRQALTIINITERIKDIKMQMV